ncbi:MAG: cytochrome c [Rhodomicrobium sp.]
MTGSSLPYPASILQPTNARHFLAAILALTLCADEFALPDVPREQAAKPYQIVDGKVDKRTYNGFRRYNAVCNHCHGPDGVGGSFGPSLIEAPMMIEEFRDAVLVGRAKGNFVMKGFADDPNVAPFVDDIYAYLRARTDGIIGRGRPKRTSAEALR